MVEAITMTGLEYFFLRKAMLTEFRNGHIKSSWVSHAISPLRLLGKPDIKHPFGLIFPPPHDSVWVVAETRRALRRA